MQDNLKLNSRFKIEKNSKLPYYYQLKQYIIEEIEAGRWKPGKKIIPEIKICEIFDISRTVVRQAYQELVNEGYLIKKKAKGTYVAMPKIPENLVQSLTGFYEDMTERGFNVKNDILLQEKVTPTKIVAEKLGLKEGEDVIVIQRLRKINSEPVALDKTFLPYKLCPKLLFEDLSSRSLYNYLEEKYKLKIDRGIRFIEAIIASEEESKKLGIKKNSPLLRVESTSYIDSGEPIEYYIALHRADKIKFVTELKRQKKITTEKNLSGFTKSGLLIIDSNEK